MARPYNRLRQRMKARGVSIYDIAKLMECSAVTISHKLTGRSPWTLAECWRTMDYLGIRPIEMARFFPRDGKNEE